MIVPKKIRLRIFTSTPVHLLSTTLRFLLVTLLFSTYVLGCRSKQVPETIPVPTFTVIPQAAVSATPEKSIEPTSTSTLAPPQPTPTRLPEPTYPTPTLLPATATVPLCGPPGNWVIYIVQSNDTLFSLARKTGTTVDEVKHANCKVNDIIYVGENLYLPSLPPPPTPVPIVPTPRPPTAMPPTASPPTDVPIETPMCSPFSCPDPDPELSEVVLPSGGPNYDFTPCICESASCNSWISVASDGDDDPNRDHYDREVGQRTYFFACDFPEPTHLSAQMTGPGGTQTLERGISIPDPDLKWGEAQRVFVWNPACDLLTGSYTLTVADDLGNQEVLTLTLKSPRFQRILAVPQPASPGETFQIYYCGYQSRANQEIKIDFYYEIGREDDGDYIFGPSTSWNVLINANGWATQALSSLSSDPSRAYYLEDRDLMLEGWDRFWLTP